MSNKRFWQTKLAARLHDPGEKSLILMRTREGHEGGTVRALRESLGLREEADSRAVKRADWWASAADRPQWPKALNDRLHWTSSPVLIHPISGEEIRLQSLRDTEPADIADRSLRHFEALREQCGGDPQKTLLAFWRFGPELSEEDDHGKLGQLWQQLPADTRVPDHSIWEHLDLTSAFAGAFVADPEGEVALLTLAIGPVQPFIAAARSTSDLWAGSHLLARLAWESMKPLVEALGPDAVLFPRLRGVPQMDLWLKDECGLPEALFKTAFGKEESTNADTNPLFAAALPNRFVALVPASQARELAERCRDHLLGWMQDLGRRTVKRLLQEAEIEAREDLYCFEQACRQLEGFPEVHWATVPFSMIRATKDDKRIEGTQALCEALAPFHSKAANEPSGFLDSPAWNVLQKEIDWEDGTAFYQPNPGVLYPAIYDLAERVLAATKAVRPFGQICEEGWRDSLTGEVEWLTTDRRQLTTSYRQQTDTLWARIATKRPAWAKQGEHLGALSAIKRLWPTLFTEDVNESLGQNFSRFVVSTHTMALAHQLDRWLEQGALTADGFTEARKESNPGQIALPTRLMLRHWGHAGLPDVRAAVAILDRAQEQGNDAKAEHLHRVVEKTLAHGHQGEGQFRLETYYGLLLMDGDRMGALLAGKVETPTYRESFHPDIREQFDRFAAGNARLREYGAMRRPPSPGRHMDISGALNDFALHVVPHVVQREYLGRLLYSGGDDVLAMLAAADLLPAAARLRDAWSGVSGYAAADDTDSQRRKLKLEKGYARLDGRLLRMMGKEATASAGLVVAHHQTPLARVLRELRAAEQATKHVDGKDALHLRILKRSGGALSLTLKWAQLKVFERLVAFLRERAVSRRAVYHCLRWLRDLPEPDTHEDMFAALLGYQFRRQTDKSVADRHNVEGLAADITRLACGRMQAREWIENFLSSAEFVGRDVRSAGLQEENGQKGEEGEAA